MTNRDDTELITDIYDVEIWKTFSSQIDTPDSSRFCTSETADSHLGIMINLDLFQPFDSLAYSCGIIYGIICNLPREVQFKKENILILGLLSGPKKNGYVISISTKFLNGKRIRLAVICCSNNIPAARKLCSHILALTGYYQCYKCANTGGRKLNFGGFEDMNDWFQE
ncbi:17918_t:CDS:2 [Funneliformis geosporum]|uniref:17918_t:CDS:1 n=1 Tax=Funneliformis geosporum TaxID=1117311 RepID=A0A9W4T2T3_9GLOM|nr:17918_t:CDS:2 [Funneliformis geosporum]